MIKISVFIFTSLALICFTFASSKQKKCKLTYESRTKAISEMNTLEKVKIVWSKHKACIDGESGEAYSEAISNLLDKNWDEVVSSKEIENKNVLNGLLNGISDVWEYNLSQRILLNAKNHCTKKAKKLCDAIIESDPLKK